MGGWLYPGVFTGPGRRMVTEGRKAPEAHAGELHEELMGRRHFLHVLLAQALSLGPGPVFPQTLSFYCTAGLLPSSASYGPYTITPVTLSGGE